MDGSGTDRPRRTQTSTERDLEGLRALKERDSRVPAGEFSDEINTGVMRAEGATPEQLKKARGERLPDQRIEHVEDRIDDLQKGQAQTNERLGKLEVGLASVSGQLAILPQVTMTLQSSIASLQQQEGARLESANLQKRDAVDANKHRRARVTKVLGAIVGLFSSGAFVHWLAGKL